MRDEMVGRRWTVALMAAGLPLASIACAEILGLSGFEKGSAPAEASAGDAPSTSDAAGLPTPCSNGVEDGDESDIDCGGSCGQCAKGQKCNSANDCPKDCVDGKCAGCAGEELTSADAGGACIDATEVRVGDYAVFVDTGPPEPYREDRARCDALDHPPSFAEQRASPELPVRKVTWCAAKTYCRWRGKRLCGALGDAGLGTESTAFADFAKDQWMAGCTNSERRLYPYDPDDYSKTLCNGIDRNLQAPWPAGSQPDCYTIGTKIYDMSGNLAEWEDVCDRQRPLRCRVRGGSFRADAGGLRCGADEIREANAGYDDVGFRCCE